MNKSLELIGDGGRFGDEQVDGRDGKEAGDLVFLVVLQETGKVELPHPEHWTSIDCWINEVSLNTGNLEICQSL